MPRRPSRRQRLLRRRYLVPTTGLDSASPQADYLLARLKARKQRLAKARARGKTKMKKPMTAAEKRAKKERQAKYQWVFKHGKQVRVPREPMFEGLPADEFTERNADPIFLVQNEMWEELAEFEEREPYGDSDR